MIALIDTFNNKVLSLHHTVESAESASAKLQAQVKRSNGNGAYIPTKVCHAEGLKKGEVLTAAEVAALSPAFVPYGWE
jgi:hypothetical protein